MQNTSLHQTTLVLSSRSCNKEAVIKLIICDEDGDWFLGEIRKVVFFSDYCCFCCSNSAHCHTWHDRELHVRLAEDMKGISDRGSCGGGRCACERERWCRGKKGWSVIQRLCWILPMPALDTHHPIVKYFSKQRNTIKKPNTFLFKLKLRY